MCYPADMTVHTPEELLARGYQARKEHRLADAHTLFGEAIDLCRKGGDQVLLAKALTGLGQIERDLERSEAALMRYEDAVAICRNLADPLLLAHTIRHVGDILRNQGQLQRAAPCYEEALQIYHKHPRTSSLDLANAIRGFALLKGATGATKEAKLLWLEARAIYAEAGVQAGVDESSEQIALLSLR